MAISTKKKTVKAKDILAKVDDYQIFRYYLGEFDIGRKFCNPIRGENKASAIIRNFDGKLLMTDYSDKSFDGDCFNLVMKAFSCSFDSALRRIDNDFNLGLFSEKVENREIVIFEKPKIKPSKPPKIFTRTSNMCKAGDEYLSKYHLTLEDMNFCRDTKVSYVHEFVKNYQRQYIGKLAIEYELSNERGRWKKIYRPYAHEDKKWDSNIPGYEIHGLSCLEKCKVLIISKSIKDGAVINKFAQLPCIMVQSENPKYFTEIVINQLNMLCKNIYVSFDSDVPGKKASIELTNATGWKHINVPDKYHAKDWADLVQHYSPDVMTEYFKSKELYKIW
jgi:hypothetical protein